MGLPQGYDPWSLSRTVDPVEVGERWFYGCCAHSRTGSTRPWRGGGSGGGWSWGTWPGPGPGRGPRPEKGSSPFAKVGSREKQEWIFAPPRGAGVPGTSLASPSGREEPARATWPIPGPTLAPTPPRYSRLHVLPIWGPGGCPPTPGGRGRTTLLRSGRDRPRGARAPRLRAVPRRPPGDNNKTEASVGQNNGRGS